MSLRKSELITYIAMNSKLVFEGDETVDELLEAYRNLRAASDVPVRSTSKKAA